ncbi:MAG: M48 family metallopeptidase [Spirochaetota bacterium]
MSRTEQSVNTLYFSVGGSEYPIYVHHNRRQKHIRLRINSDGQITVSAPAGTSRAKIQSILQHKEGWLVTKILETTRALERNNPAKKIHIDGMPFRVDFQLSDQVTYRLNVDYEQQCILITGPEQTPSHITSLLERWLRREAKQRLTSHAQSVSKEVGIVYNKLFLRNQKTRWGSSSTLGNISLNWRTVMLPKPVQRYLIVHELVHQRHMNHSAQFWRNVVHFCPDYKQHELWLKQHRSLMGLFRARPISE